jgi:hypothetical protein
MLRVHSLWGALAARVACGSVPARRNDPCRLALAVEGGGSRAAFCIGMALAVERRGLLLCFDDVYALSSGALTAAWLPSGRASVAAELWADPRVLELAIDPTRLLRGRPVFDTEYLTNVAGGVGWRAVLAISRRRSHPGANGSSSAATWPCAAGARSGRGPPVPARNRG